MSKKNRIKKIILFLKQKNFFLKKKNKISFGAGQVLNCESTVTNITINSGSNIQAGVTNLETSNNTNSPTLSHSGFSQKLYPNPTQGSVALEIETETEEDATISFTDIVGREILTERRYLDKGINTLNFDLKYFAKGMFMVFINTPSGNKQTAKLIKL